MSDETATVPVPERRGIFKPGPDPRRPQKGVPVGPRAATRAAMEILQAKAEEMANNLLEMTTRLRDPDGGDKCSMCGRGYLRNEDVRLRATTAVLDRVGLGPQTKISLEEEQNTDWVRFLTDDELDQLTKLVEVATERAQKDSEESTVSVAPAPPQVNPVEEPEPVVEVEDEDQTSDPVS